VPFIVSHLRRYAKAGDRVLDVGCGAGLYRNTTAADYVGLDITDDPYRPGVPRDVDVVASACSMPFGDAEFDLVFSVSSFFQIPCWRDALAEMYRVLGRGGRVVLFDYNRRGQRRLARLDDVELPAWTQLGLLRHVRAAGFSDCELLAPTDEPVGGLRRIRLLAVEELRGQWALATGRVPGDGPSARRGP
jgi:SAM-dependent methyltransferase